jgi:hypothetical protein
MKAVVMVSLAAVSLAISWASEAHSVFDGTWKADLDKNRRTEKPDVLELGHGKYECRTCTPPFAIAADGRDHPIVGNPFYDTLSISVVDDHVLRKVAKKAGQTVANITVTVSGDGMTQSVHQQVSMPGQPVFEVTQTFARVAAGAAGSHAVSGTWQQIKTEGSDNVDVTTFKLQGDRLSMSSQTGEGYTAKLDGVEVPFRGRPGVTSVAVRKVDDHTIEETWRDGAQVVMKTRWWVDPDGRTMHARFDDTHGAVMEQTGHKVQ